MIGVGLTIGGVLIVPAHGSSDPVALALVVRVYPYSTAPLEVVYAGQEAAGALLESAGVQTIWIECGRLNDGHSDKMCARQLVANEVVLRIMQGEPGGGQRMVLGDSLLAGLQYPSFSTLYLEPILAVAKTARMSASQLVGRVIAHELGHLLLRNSRHPRTGLMRAVWSPTELKRDRPSDWLFLANEREAIRAAVGARSAHELRTARR